MRRKGTSFKKVKTMIVRPAIGSTGRTRNLLIFHLVTVIIKLTFQSSFSLETRLQKDQEIKYMPDWFSIGTVFKRKILLTGLKETFKSKC